MFIPGRIEIFGKHTDYCGGQSLLCAVDRGFTVEFSERKDGLISVESLDSGEKAIFEFNGTSDKEFHWTNYARTVIKRISGNFISSQLNGVNIAFRSNLPMASGLSSSSAFMIAVFSAISSVNDLQNSKEFRSNISDKLDLAEYLGTIENGQTFRELKGIKGVGTFGGSQDHTAILCCKNGLVSHFSFAPVTHLGDLPFPEEFCFVIASSGVKAEKTAGALERYNRVSLMVSAIVSAWNGEEKTLAEILANTSLNTVKQFISNSTLPYETKDLFERAEQFFIENFELIPNAAKALLAKDIEDFGRLAEISHQNADGLLKNQVPETNFLQNSARAIGSPASSAFGAGFGGSVYAIVPKTNSDSFVNDWKKRYLEKFPARKDDSEFFICNI